MEKECTLNSADFVECCYESSKEINRIIEDSSDETKPVIEVKWLKEEIKTECMDDEEKMDEKREFMEESGRMQTENKGSLQLDDKNLILEKDQNIACGVKKVKVEYDPLQYVNEENDPLQFVKEEITMIYDILDQEDFVKDETVEGKL